MEVTSPVIFSFDVETVGLYGEPFAFGWVLLSLDKETPKEIESGYEACPISTANGDAEGRQWVLTHVVPSLPKKTTVNNPTELYEKVWKVWEEVKKRYKKVLCVADCGYPVETSFFRKCVELKPKERRFDGPFPLHEVGTALLMAGMNSDDFPRDKNEEPNHHPTNDARYSGRLFRTAFLKCQH
jgi:hypothetical protein